MAFTSVKNDGGLMKEGEYEVFVSAAEETETKTGKPCIKFDFVVRQDVEQPYQRKHIFKNFYPDDSGNYPADKIGKYASSMGIAPGEEFELEDLVGKDCVLVIKHFTGDDGQTRACILYTKESKAGESIQTLAPQPEYAELEEDDGDLPF